MLTARKLGFFETGCKFAHDFFASTSNVIARANISGPVSVKYLQLALKCLFLRHPLLRAVISDNSSELCFQLTSDVSDIPFNVITRADDNQWYSVVIAEMQQQFLIQKYLWRATILFSATQQKHELIFAFHHAIADGLSTANFIHELLQTYTILAAGKKAKVISLPSLPAIETMLTEKNTWEFFLKEKEKINNSFIEAWEFATFKPIQQRRMCNIYRILHPQQLLVLKQRCRAENTTINAALNAALLNAAQKQRINDINTTLHTPVNLREYCTPKLTRDHIGCYISMVTTVHQAIGQNNFWQLARDYRAQLLKNIPKIGFYPGDFNLNNFSMVDLINLFDMPGSTKRKHFSGGFGVTNIGEINLSFSYGSLQLNDFMFCTNHVMGEYILFLHVVTLNGKMSFCFSYADPLLSTDWAEAVANEFIKILLDVII